MNLIFFKFLETFRTKSILNLFSPLDYLGSKILVIKFVLNGS